MRWAQQLTGGDAWNFSCGRPDKPNCPDKAGPDHDFGSSPILRDLVNATIGFEGLAAEIHKPSKSLHRMLAPWGNPSTENFFLIVCVLQKKTHVKLRVTANPVQARISTKDSRTKAG